VTVDENRSGVMLIRAWVEQGTGEFRARMTTPGTSHGSGEERDLTVALASSPDGVSDAVRVWLAELLSSDVPGAGAPPPGDPLPTRGQPRRLQR
jgi:hypothetical protein